MLNFEEIKTNNILELDSIDSTNNYAQTLIASGDYMHGMVIQAKFQTAGRGQRGNDWHSEAGENLLMSVIIDHKGSVLESQYVLNMAVSLAVTEAIFRFIGEGNCTVKWSNDIYINDEKVGGLLIENILRGNSWSQSIIGIGVNVNAQFLKGNLINATSLYSQMGELIDLNMFRNELIHCLNDYLNWAKIDEHGVWLKYNSMLYKREQLQMFSLNQHIITRKIIGVNAQGAIVLSMGDAQENYNYGEIKQLIGGVN